MAKVRSNDGIRNSCRKRVVKSSLGQFSDSCEVFSDLFFGCCGSGKWPDSGTSATVVRRGRKSSFGTREQKSQKGVLHRQNLVLRRCNQHFTGAKGVRPDCAQRPFAPSPNHFGAISLNPVICQNHSFPNLFWLCHDLVSGFCNDLPATRQRMARQRICPDSGLGLSKSPTLQDF